MGTIDLNDVIAFGQSKRLFSGAVTTTRTSEETTGFSGAGTVALALSVRGVSGTPAVVVEGSVDGETWEEVADFGEIEQAGAYATKVVNPPDRLRFAMTGVLQRAIIAARVYPGGAGGARVVTAEINGLAKDYDPPGGIDNCDVLLIDASAKPWQAGASYGLDSRTTGSGGSVIMAGDPERPFIAYFASHVRSGATEPEWPSAAFGASSDLFVEGDAYGVMTGYMEWAAEATLEAAGYMIADGKLWYPTAEGFPASTGEDEPDWDSAPNLSDTVVDGDITWHNQGRSVAIWAPNTNFPIALSEDKLNYFFPVILPADSDGAFFDPWATIAVRLDSGEEEPDWDSVPDSGYVADGDVMWNQSEADMMFRITGMAAPSEDKSLLVSSAASPADSGECVRIYDKTDAESQHGPYAVSEEGNRFSNGGSNIGLYPLYGVQLIYTQGEWRACNTNF